MRITCFVLSLCLQLSIFLSVSYAEISHHCRMCGMESAKSQTEFTLIWDDRSNDFACCLHCVYLLQNFKENNKVIKLETKDFSSGLFIDARKAYYLEGSSLYPKGSMAPFLLAFSTVEKAETYKRKYSGNIVDFSNAMDLVMRFDKEVAASKPKK